MQKRITQNRKIYKITVFRTIKKVYKKQKNLDFT